MLFILTSKILHRSYLSKSCEEIDLFAVSCKCDISLFALCSLAVDHASSLFLRSAVHGVDAGTVWMGFRIIS